MEVFINILHTNKERFNLRKTEIESTWLNDVKFNNLPYRFVFGDETLNDNYHDNGTELCFNTSDEFNNIFMKRVYLFGKWFLENRNETHVLFIDSDCYLHVTKFLSDFGYLSKSFKEIDYMGCIYPYPGFNPHESFYRYISDKNSFVSGSCFLLSSKSLKLLIESYDEVTKLNIDYGKDDVIISNILQKNKIPILHNNNVCFESKYRRLINDPHNIGVPDISEKNSHLWCQHYLEGHLNEIHEKIKHNEHRSIHG